VPSRTLQHLPDRSNNVNSQRPLLVTLDPGKTTGAAVLYPNGWWTLAEFDSLPALWDLLTQIQPTLVVCEKFVWQPRPSDVSALEYIGVTKLYVQQRFDVNIVMQMPSAAKNFVSDTMLRRNDMFDPSKGMRHARDAIRHTIYFLTHGLGDQSWVEAMR
jgi:hypothetical protein